MSTGVALAWATEATEKGIISEKETIVRLAFGDSEGYKKAMQHLGEGATGFRPDEVAIPKRFTEIATGKGPVDGQFLESLKTAYGQRILELARDEGNG